MQPQACRLHETADGSVLVGVDFKQCVNPGDLEQIVNLLGDVDQLQLAALLVDCGIAADQLADAEAVDEVHPGHIHQELFVALVNQDVQSVAERGAACSESELPAGVNHGHAQPLACTGLKNHGGSCPRLRVLSLLLAQNHTLVKVERKRRSLARRLQTTDKLRGRLVDVGGFEPRPPALRRRPCLLRWPSFQNATSQKTPFLSAVMDLYQPWCR